MTYTFEQKFVKANEASATIEAIAKVLEMWPDEVSKIYDTVFNLPKNKVMTRKEFNAFMDSGKYPIKRETKFDNYDSEKKGPRKK